MRTEKNYLLYQEDDFWRKNNSSFLKLDFLFAEQNFNYVFLVNSQHSFIHIFKHSLEITECLSHGSNLLELDLNARQYSVKIMSNAVHSNSKGICSSM